VASIVRAISVVESQWMWVFVSTEKATEMASANQFYYFILERFAFICSVAIVSMVAPVFGHVYIGGLDVL